MLTVVIYTVRTRLHSLSRLPKISTGTCQLETNEERRNLPGGKIFFAAAQVDLDNDDDKWINSYENVAPGVKNE